MKKKNWILRLLFFSLLFMLFAFGCGISEDDGEKQPIDYSKYEYYGNYTFGGTFQDGSQIELELTLKENHNYTMHLQVFTYASGLSYIDEIGTYQMNRLDEPISDETMEVIYRISFNGTRSVGYVGETILTYNGYITANYLKNFQFAYCDLINQGATVLYFNENVVYSMRYRALTYNIVYTAGTGGNIFGASGQVVKSGEDGTEVTAVPDYGYVFQYWSDGVYNATRRETDVHNDKELTAYFVENLPKYTLTYNNTTGGSIEGERTQTLFEGLDGTTVKAVPMERYGSYGSNLPAYEFLGWSDGVTTPERTDLNVQDNLTVTAQFGAQWVYYGTTLEGGGSVSVSGEIANKSNNYTLTATATAGEGWAFVEWSDGVKTATRTDVLTEDKTVEAIFARAIVLIAKTGGKISFNGQVDTQITALLRKPLAGDASPIAEAIADSGYEAYGWSNYEDGHYLDSYNGYLLLNYYYPSYSVYYAFFVPTEEENGNVENEDNNGDNNENQNSGTPTACNHKNIALGAFCNVCKGECYVRKETDILMYYEENGSLVAEYYGETVTNVFEVYNSQLTGVYLADTVTRIDDSTFDNSSLTNIVFSKNLIEIGYDAFYNCRNLSSITLPDSLITIGSQAFYNSSSLSEITIGENVRYIGGNAFSYTDWWNKQEYNPVVYLGNVCLGVKGNLPLRTTVEIQAGTKAIADGAFYKQGGLRGIVFPSTLTHIGESAFANCPAFLNITSGGNVEYVGENAFASTAYYDSKAFVDNVFYFDKVLVKANTALSGAYTVKSGTLSINHYAFYKCDKLTEIVLPYTIEHIGDNAFAHCTSLEKVDFPKNLKEIARYAFYYCSSLKEIVLPKNLKEIGAYAFYYCSSLKEIVLPKNLKEIGVYAFYGCYYMQVIVPKGVEKIGDSAFSCYVYCEAEEKPSSWEWGLCEYTYFYSENEPALNADKTGYDGKYWHYGDNGEIVVWKYKNPNE